MRWALAGRPQSVVDPSYGGCAVLRVALDELAAMGASAPARFIHGADIDGGTAKWAAHLVSQGVPTENLVSGDFLAFEPGRQLPIAGAVVGNPPYVRHHRLTPAAKAAAAAAALAAGVRLDGKASLWAYFVIHAARFVRPGGRMALLLPGAAAQADYAAAVIEYVERRFDDVVLVRVGERIFTDAQEETVVLLASGSREMGVRAPCRFAEVHDLAELERLLAGTAMSPDHEPGPILEGVSDWKLGVVPSACLDLLSQLLDHEDVRRLGDVTRVCLGTVTGANDVFVVTEDEADRLGVRDMTLPVVTRARLLDRPVLTASRLAAANLGRPGRLLVLPADLAVDGRTRLGRYLTAAEERGIADRHHCRRKPWWSLRDVQRPDAFLPYTVATPRGLTINAGQGASTNTVHQVSWSADTSAELVGSWVLSTWSTVGRLCTELYGRHLGGGVLKLELSGAQRLPVIDCIRAGDSSWRELSSEAAASAAADSLLLASRLGLGQGDLDAFGDAADMLAARRIGQRSAPAAGTRAADHQRVRPA